MSGFIGIEGSTNKSERKAAALIQGALDLNRAV